jgi:hypothetical protein
VSGGGPNGSLPSCKRTGERSRAVTPATWQQVHDDNLTAGECRNGQRTTRHYWVHADGINVGVARVALFWPGATKPALSWPVRARPRASVPGGELFLETRLPACGIRPNAIIRVRDPHSLRWSSSRRVGDRVHGPVAVRPRS